MALSAAHRARSWRDWVGLDAGPAGLVAEHVLRNDVVDFVRFRAASRAWRACSTHLRAQGVLDRRFHPRRWIMLPETFNVGDRRRLFNVFTGKSVHKALPVQEPRRCRPRLLCHVEEHISLVETTTTANQPPQLVAVADHKTHTDAFKIPMYEERTRMFLVENNGELILCLHARPEPHIQSTLTSCGVYQVDFDGKKTVALHGLSGKVLFLGRRRSLMAAAGVSPNINGDTAYLCYPSPKDDPIYAIDLLGGGHVEHKFAKDDATYCLSCYVIDYNRECI
ncbi:hypothetical protein VPH35_118571 [Triticum aestivum]|uniref:KIB1-4 beta-propeller domain-containing protein n=1 Tax=Aegilops tauschii TaxID=37682 RepID=N1QVG8_AEGTA